MQEDPHTTSRLLFVCNRNRLRSPTAEAIFSSLPGVEASSAGTSADADNPISPELIEWADIILVMEQVHRKRINERFKSLVRNKKVVVLGIPDKYDFMDADLIALLKSKVLRYLPAK